MDGYVGGVLIFLGPIMYSRHIIIYEHTLFHLFIYTLVDNSIIYY
jgi:predicted membrane channel-forming protein YqfA (hemolysin III family)